MAKDTETNGKSPTTQAGEFVREENGTRSNQQTITTGLSKARRAGVDLPSQSESEQDQLSQKKSSQTRQSRRSAGKPSNRKAAATRSRPRKSKTSSARRSRGNAS